MLYLQLYGVGKDKFGMDWQLMHETEEMSGIESPGEVESRSKRIKEGEVRAMTEKINRAAVDELRKGLTRDILLPEHPDYNSIRKIFNAMIDKRPSIITWCANAEDIVSAVRFGHFFL